jgi:hypothetical protein
LIYYSQRTTTLKCEFGELVAVKTWTTQGKEYATRFDFSGIGADFGVAQKGRVEDVLDDVHMKKESP